MMEMLARVEAQSALWFVLNCEPTRERLARNYLETKRFEAYLPEIAAVSPRGVRRRWMHYKKPMFPGYLFLKFDRAAGVFNAITGRYETAIERVLTTPGVRDFLKIGDRCPVLTDEIINSVRATESGERELKQPKYSHAFAVGEEVRIGAGLFSGYNGRVDELDDKTRITILISMLGRAVKVQLDYSFLEKL